MSTLQDSLAAEIRSRPHWLAWTELPLGSVLHQAGEVPRADVLAMKKSYNLRLCIYELKESRRDFTHDVQSGKYEKYLPFCHQLYFACPRGLVKITEVPEGCGLMVHSQDKGWHTLRAPTVRRVEIPYNLLLVCLFRGHEEALQRRRLRDRMVLEENVRLGERALGLGYEVRNKLNSVQAEWEQIEKAKVLIEQVTGHGASSLSDAVWHLQAWLKARAPGTEQFELARDLVQVAHELVATGDGSLSHWGAYARVERFVDERRAASAQADGGVRLRRTGEKAAGPSLAAW